MTALRTRLANMMTDLSIWLDCLSNWQFPAVLAALYILCYAAYVIISDLAGSHVNLRYLIPQAALLGIVLIAGISWRQWK